MQLRELWHEGRVEPIPASAILIWPQLYYTNPLVIQDLQFRRAMMHAMNRQEMVETLQGGLTAVMHSVFYPGQPQFEAIDRSVSKYEYDPRRAVQMIEGLGYTKGSDGLFRDASGQPLSIELRSSTMSINQKSRLAVGDYWKQIGVDVEHHVYPPARQREQPYRATFPGFQLNRNPVDLDIVSRFHSSQLATEANGWRGEDSGYQNPEYDSLYERYSVTIPLAERQQLVGQIARHLADELPVLGLYYDTEPLALRNKMLNVAVPIGGRVTGVASVFSIYQWDVR
jgi:peptide/nickel transport system substrate-binding protein